MIRSTNKTLSLQVNLLGTCFFVIRINLFIGIFFVAGETWLEKVQRKLQYAIPDHGTWGETLDNYEVFVRGGPGEVFFCCYYIPIRSGV